MSILVNKKLFIFDLGGTLIKDKSPISPQIAELISKLLDKYKVAITSGNSLIYLQNNVITPLSRVLDKFGNLLILPDSGSKLYAWRGEWTPLFLEEFSKAEKDEAMSCLNTALRLANFNINTKAYGEIIEDRGTQITFSALGQNAPSNEENLWDPDRSKRKVIVDNIKSRTNLFDIRIRGAASIDITKRGVNKAYGVRKLEEIMKIKQEELIFIGNELSSVGNDYPIKAVGVDCVQVNSPEETLKIEGYW